MLRGPLNGSMQDYRYDARNLLIQAGDVSYGYDNENNRNSMTANGVTTKQIINPHAVLSQVLMGSIDNGLTMNRYAYVNGNPVSYIDPFGLSADGTDWYITVGDVLADMTPIVGSAKSWQQVFTGVNYVTGEQLTIGDRVADAAGGITGLFPIPGSKYAGKYTAKGLIWTGEKAVYVFGWSTKVKKSAGKLVDGCNCFTAGTKVKTDQGEKNIEDIQVGDRVLSKDEATGKEDYKAVTATFNHMTEEIYTIHVGDQEIESTYNHPFWVEGKGWTYVKDLKVGDLLVKDDGTTLDIKDIQREERQVRVYNMTVADFHTYFVSDLGIWVHNTGICNFNLNLPSKVVPRGFKNVQQYDQAMNELKKILDGAGLEVSSIQIRGSSASGLSSKGDGLFRESSEYGLKPSDIDLGIELKNSLDNMNSSKNQPGFYHPNKIMKKYPELQRWSEKWSDILGREITPGAWQPGTLPVDPTNIIVR